MVRITLRERPFYATDPSSVNISQLEMDELTGGMGKIEWSKDPTTLGARERKSGRSENTAGPLKSGSLDARACVDEIVWSVGLSIVVKGVAGPPIAGKSLGASVG